MKTPRFFAVDAWLGRAAPASPLVRPDAADLTARMEGLPIAAAVVRSSDAPGMEPSYVNAALRRQTAKTAGRLVPAHYVTPALPVEPAARIAWAAPRAEGVPLEDWCYGPLATVLSDRRIPLLLAAEQVDWTALDRLLGAYPALRVVMTELPRIGRQVAHLRLLERHPELHFAFSPSFSLHAGYAALVERFGPERFVWGMGYPLSEPGAALTGLLYAGLAPSALAAVAHGNLERLLADAEAAHG